MDEIFVRDSTQSSYNKRRTRKSGTKCVPQRYFDHTNALAYQEILQNMRGCHSDTDTWEQLHNWMIRCICYGGTVLGWAVQVYRYVQRLWNQQKSDEWTKKLPSTWLDRIVKVYDVRCDCRTNKNFSPSMTTETKNSRKRWAPVLTKIKSMAPYIATTTNPVSLLRVAAKTKTSSLSANVQYNKDRLSIEKYRYM